MAKKKNSLGSALVTILVSALICVVLTITAAVVTGEPLYYVAAALFGISGLAGVYVIRNLTRKMNKK